MFQWLVAGLILAVWFVLKVFMHKSGYVHILLLLGLSIFIVQLISVRNTRYHARLSDSDHS